VQSVLVRARRWPGICVVQAKATCDGSLFMTCVKILNLTLQYAAGYIQVQTHDVARSLRMARRTASLRLIDSIAAGNTAPRTPAPC
jgi:hypothetical protein